MGQVELFPSIKWTRVDTKGRHMILISWNKSSARSFDFQGGSVNYYSSIKADSPATETGGFCPLVIVIGSQTNCIYLWTGPKHDIDPLIGFFLGPYIIGDPRLYDVK